MVKTLLMALLALIQAFGACSQGVFVLCVRNDGTTRIEAVWALSCQQSHSKCPCGCCSCDEDEGEDTSRSKEPCPEPTPGIQGWKCPHCTDYPLSFVSGPVAPEKHERAVLADMSRGGGPDALLTTVFAFLPSPSKAFHACCGPPPAGALTHLATTILRC